MSDRSAAPVPTPEHLQLLSTRRLEAAAHVREATGARASENGSFARLAQRELTRRQGAGAAPSR